MPRIYHFIEKIDLIEKWEIELGSKNHFDFIEELINIEHSLEECKQRYLSSLARAQNNGDIREDINLELIWILREKINEMFKDGSWEKITSNFGGFQRQVRIILYYGLLARDKSDEFLATV